MNSEREKPVLDYQPSPQSPTIWPIIRVAVAIGGLGPTLLGLMWIRTFATTNYRAHLAPIGLLFGIFSASIGLAMISVPFVYASCKRSPEKAKGSERENGTTDYTDFTD